MSNARSRFSGLAAALIAVAVLMSYASASAEANWLVEGAELTANETVSVSRNTPWTLLASNGIEIKCTETQGESLQLIGKSSEATGNIALNSCKTFNKGTAASSCDPINQPIKFGIKILLILHNGSVYILLHPPTGKPLTTIEFAAKCALVETSEVTGSQVDECGHLIIPGSTWVFLSCNNGKIEQFVQPAPAALFPSDSLKFGELKASVDGIAELELSGANKGKLWGGTI